MLQFYSFMDFQITFEKIPQALWLSKKPNNTFSKTYKKPKHQSHDMCQLPRKKPNIEKKKPKTPNNVFNAKCLSKKPWRQKSQSGNLSKPDFSSRSFSLDARKAIFLKVKTAHNKDFSDQENAQAVQNNTITG